MKVMGMRGLMVVLVGILSAPIAGAGTLTHRDGVPCMQNSDEPSEGRVTRTLQERWRVTSEDEGDVLLGTVKQVLADADGTVYMLDQQLSQVHIFTADGEYVRSIGREGDGPGECRRPMAMVRLPEGIGLLQAFPARIVAIDLEGNPLEPFDLRAKGQAVSDRFALSVKYDSGVLAYTGRTISMGGGSRAPKDMLVVCGPDGQEKAILLEKQGQDLMETRRWVEADEYFPHGGRWAIGPGGTIYTAPLRDTYAIHILSPDGTLQRIVERRFTSRKRTEEEKAGMGIQMNNNGQDIAIDNVIADHPPCINGFHVTQRGEIWVLNNRGDGSQPEGILRTYDVFSPAGHYLREVAIACDETLGDDDQIFWVGDDRLVVIKGFDPRISISIGPGGDDVDVSGEERPPLEVIYYTMSLS